MDSALDLSREIARHEAHATAVAREARLPSSFLLSSGIVAVPALLEAHAAAEAELEMPGPKVFFCNALVLLGASAALLVWVLSSTAWLPSPAQSSSEAFPELLGAILSWVQRVPAALWASYQHAVGASPVLIKALITGTTYVVGDMLAQVLQQTSAVRRQQLRPRPCLEKTLRMDQARYARAGLVGFFPLGPLAHYYYEFVQDSLGEWPAACKIALDQTLYLSLYNTLYFLALGRLAGKPLNELVLQYRQQFWQLLTAGWRIWPFVGVVTYTFVPTQHRVLFVDVVEIAYSALLSTLTADAHAGYTGVPTARQSVECGAAAAACASSARGRTAPADASHVRASGVASVAEHSAGDLDLDLEAELSAGGRVLARPERANAAPSPPHPAVDGESSRPLQPPRTWEELVEAAGPGGACYWCVAGSLPEGVQHRHQPACATSGTTIQPPPPGAGPA